VFASPSCKVRSEKAKALLVSLAVSSSAEEFKFSCCVVVCVFW
jgi:hypothetical protein